MENDDPTQHSRLAALGRHDADCFPFRNAISNRPSELEALNSASHFWVRRCCFSMSKVAGVLRSILSAYSAASTARNAPQWNEESGARIPSGGCAERARST